MRGVVFGLFTFISSLKANFACTIHLGVWRKAAKCLENHLAVYIIEFIHMSKVIHRKIDLTLSHLFCRQYETKEGGQSIYKKKKFKKTFREAS